MQRPQSKRSPDPPLFPVHADEVIDECRRRIEAIYPPTVQTVVLLQGGDAMERMRANIAALRACQEELLAMSPIPHQYRSDHYWRVPSVLGNAPGQFVQPAAVSPVPPQVIVVPQQAIAPPAAAPPTPVIVQMMPAQPMQVAPAQPVHVAPMQTVPPSALHAVPAQSNAVQVPAGSRRAESVTPPVVAAPPSVPSVSPRAERLPVAAPPSRDPGIEVWDENAERLYQTCRRALEGDGKAHDMIKTLAEIERIPVRSFCERVISERARTIEVFSRMQAVR